MATFSDRLNEAMRLKGIRAIDLSKKTGISKSRISQYVHGIYEAKQTALYLLAKALDVSEAWLMGYDVPMERDRRANTENIEAGDVIIYHRDGKTTKKHLTVEQMAMLVGLLDAIPDTDE